MNDESMRERSPGGPGSAHGLPGLQPGARVAVIGSGIAGLSAAWLLSRHYSIRVFERDSWIGGHSNTVDVRRPGGGTQPVDTGFIVYNERNYPNLTRLFATLGVATQPSPMSFSVSLDHGRREYGSRLPFGLLAQPGNLLDGRFLAMLRDLRRFYREGAVELVRLESDEGVGPALGDWLAAQGYGASFVEDHLLPMVAAIWSAPAAVMRRMPVVTCLRFLRNHGLLGFGDRPRWRTVSGGSRQYVRALTTAFRGRIATNCAARQVRRESGGVIVADVRGNEEVFDHAVLACHADQALALLAAPTAEERRLLGAISYETNHAMLHSDDDLMPIRRAAWGSWNYLADRDADGRARLSVTYWMNKLQGLRGDLPLFVTLNPPRQPDARLVHQEFTYHHPVFDERAIAAQRELSSLQGVGGLWYCGSYFGHGFHEDALVAGLAVAERLGVVAPWRLAAEDSRPRPLRAVSLRPA